MIIDDVNHAIDTWITALQRYDFDLLLLKPGPESWSLGQVYMHLINETRYYTEQAEACLGNDENASGEMKAAAKKMFIHNAFPDIIVKGDPLIAGNTPQPESELFLLQALGLIKQRVNDLWNRISSDTCHGKTMHPGLGYFDAPEWIQYTGMHLRHHLRQKKRIDEWLKASGQALVNGDA